MISSDPTVEKEVFKIYDKWLHSYLNGDVETYSLYLDDEYHFIGSTGNEEFLNKKATTNFFEATAEQLAGKTEIRNSKRTLETFGDLVFITELLDAYFLSGTEWNFYGRFRFSSVMRKTSDGWRFIYQHFSMPDSKAQEGETIGYNQISEENLKLREAISRRTVELENKSRELEIEAALERVRSRSMAMHNSDELAEVIQVVYDQFVSLDIPVDHAGFILDYKEREDMHIWLTDHQQGVPSEITISYFDSPHWNSFAEAKSKGESFFANLLNFEEKNKFYEGLMELIPPMPEETVQTIYEKPGLVISTVLLDNVGLYIENYSTTPFTEEENKMLMRFGKAFQQTYTRFLDLQRAEAQAREAKIETALEKVRSRTMGMQSSEELADVAFVLFEQLRGLGGNLWGTGFGLCEKDRDKDSFWFANENGVFPPVSIPNTTDPAHRQMFEGWKAGKDFLAMAASGKDLKSHYNYMLSLPEVKPFFQKIIDEGLSFPDWQQWNAAYFKHGYLLIITLESYPDSGILTRFAKVFDQTYTRFLDLQKAEAQAREAQIEAALERTRTQSMLMQHSDEIKNISEVFHQQLLTLNIPTEFSYVWLPDESENKHQFWASWAEEAKGGLNFISKQVTYPLDKTEPYTAACYQAWSKPEIIHEEFIPPSDISDFFGTWAELLEGAQNLKPNNFKEGIYYSEAYMRYGCFGINIRRELSDEEKGVLKRFSTEFERAYTRFLDLQKSEAQAREAQINLAVERVRAKALAMFKSEEILQVVNTLKNEIMGLNIPNVSAASIHLREGDGRHRIWDLTSIEDSENGLEISLDVTYKLEDTHPDFFMREVWEKTEDYFVVVQDLNRFPHTIDWLKKSGHSDYADEFAAFLEESGLEKAYHPTVLLQNGRMSVDLLAEPTPEIEIILIKMAGAFDLAYKRFEDLQKAEAQAREAKIETALEKVRARTLGMQKSDELADVANVLFEEMNELVHNLWTCGFVLCEKGRDEDEWWLGLDEGFTRGFFLPNVNDYAHAHLYEGWLKKEDFRTVQLEGDDLQAHYDWLMGIPVAKNIFEEMKAAGMERPDWQKLHAAYFSKGYLVIITREPCPEEAIFKRFAQVFDLTYTRFLDLQKAESQARESQIELSLERIRAQVTGMQESSDLLDIVVTMRTEFVNLGHEAHYFWHMRWLPDTYRKAMTSGDGTKIGMVMTLPRHIHGDIEEVAAWEKTKDPIHVLAMDVDVAVDYVDKMITLGDFERVDPQAPTLDDIRHIGGLTFVMARTTHGEIGFSLPGVVPDPPKDAVDTLIRFAGVFDLAYKRFEDLKTAEKDLIEIKRARQKAEDALIELKATQTQLVQQEKLASLGQLTAGIAHEIKNPLNFVNNFSEVSVELIDEALEEIEKLDDSDVKEEIVEILNDVKGNLTKVHSHGTRADSIVKSMLQHSRGGSGKMEPTDLNALIKEYVNLSFHGMRAGKNPINVDIQLDLDEDIGQVNLIGEDFSRVLLNLSNNAFDAMREKAKTATDYLPALSVKTQRTPNDELRITISDNGPGIPDEIKDKILQPFFTTKKGTDGTGLGLSITNDIIKAHGGEITIDSSQGKGTTFSIHLPTKRL